MAKVSRRIKEEPIEVKKVLSHDEHLQVETQPLVVENAKLLMAVEEQALANLILEFKILEIKIEKQKVVLGECHFKYNNVKARYSQVIGDIMKNHKLISENFGYNNNTGEIIPATKE